jgi:hypothetical protein
LTEPATSRSNGKKRIHQALCLVRREPGYAGNFTRFSMEKDCIRPCYTTRTKKEEKNGHALESRFPVFFYNAMEYLLKIVTLPVFFVFLKAQHPGEA